MALAGTLILEPFVDKVAGQPVLNVLPTDPVPAELRILPALQELNLGISKLSSESQQVNLIISIHQIRHKSRVDSCHI